MVVDDVTVTGSMNLSAAGVWLNHENTFFVEEPDLADTAAELIGAEASLLASMGIDDACGAR